MRDLSNLSSKVSVSLNIFPIFTNAMSNSVPQTPHTCTTISPYMLLKCLSLYSTKILFQHYLNLTV